jgi:hypothetical protein
MAREGVPMALINFGKESAPKHFRGFVKGLGAFSYTSVSGEYKTIFKFTKITRDEAVSSGDPKKDRERKVQAIKAKELEEKDKQEKLLSDQKAAERLEEERKLAEKKQADAQARQKRLADERLAAEEERTNRQIEKKLKESGLLIENGVIIDNSSGLMWPANANLNGQMMYKPAIRWIDKLNYAGYSDWRMPSSSELETISKYGSDVLNKIVTNLQKGCYWSTTKNGSSLFHKHCVDVIGNYVSYDDYQFHAEKDEGREHNIWPVRGGGVLNWFRGKASKPSSANEKPREIEGDI